jgi:hypothetical protein
MLTATHQHTLLKRKGKKNAKLERKYYSKYVLEFDICTLSYVLEFDIRTLFYVLKFDVCTLLNVLKVRISNLST